MGWVQDVDRGGAQVSRLKISYETPACRQPHHSCWLTDSDRAVARVLTTIGCYCHGPFSGCTEPLAATAPPPVAAAAGPSRGERYPIRSVAVGIPAGLSPTHYHTVTFAVRSLSVNRSDRVSFRAPRDVRHPLAAIGRRARVAPEWPWRRTGGAAARTGPPGRGHGGSQRPT